MNTSERGRHPVRRRILLAAAAVAVGVLLANITYRTSVEPGALLVKTVFEAGHEVTPPSAYPSIAAAVDEPQTVTLRSENAPDARLRILTPRSRRDAPYPIVLWIHGGGFISSSADTVEDYAVVLAHQGFVVADLDYSIAPAAQHPVPVRQGDVALGFLRHHGARYGGDPTRIFLGGDSAGAQIASELASVETSPSLASEVGITPSAEGVIRGVVLFCGLYDMSTVASTGFPGLRTYLWAYTGHRDWLRAPDVGQMSTTATATADYPPTFLSVGDADPFHTQESEFARALREKAVPVTELTWNGTGDHLGHEYQFDLTTPQADRALAKTVAFLRSAAAR